MKPHADGLIIGAFALAVLLGGVAMLSVANGQPGGTPPRGKSGPGVLSTLVPLKLEERMESQTKLLEERTQTIGALLLLVNELKDSSEESYQNSRLCFAVRMLGILRAAEAAQPLLDVIDRRFPGANHTDSPPEDPEVVQALIQIGKPASTKAIEYLASDKSSKRAPMYVRVIAQVEGIELGKVMVRLAADKEKDPEKKARLEAAIGLFDKASEPIP